MSRPKAGGIAGVLLVLLAGCASKAPNTTPGNSAPTTVPEASTPCTTASDCSATDDCVGDRCVPFAVCPAGIEPSFDSIRENVFAKSCAIGSSCHSAAGAASATGFDLETDPYTELLGADGKGATAANIDGSVRKLLRVVPGDPDHSYLVIKLGLKTNRDPQYGSGMPQTDPGSVCAVTVDAIRAWIQAGALNSPTVRDSSTD